AVREDSGHRHARLVLWMVQQQVHYGIRSNRPHSTESRNSRVPQRVACEGGFQRPGIVEQPANLWQSRRTDVGDCSDANVADLLLEAMCHGAIECDTSYCPTGSPKQSFGRLWAVLWQQPLYGLLLLRIARENRSREKLLCRRWAKGQDLPLSLCTHRFVLVR